MSEAINELRKKIFALRKQLSEVVNQRITHLASQFGYNENWYFEDVMRRAAGNGLPEPSDITIEGQEAYERFWSFLSQKCVSAETLKDFEVDYIADVLDGDDASVPDFMVSRFIERLTKETGDQIALLVEDYSPRWDLPLSEVFAAAKLSDLAFQKYEKHILTKKVQAEFERVVEKELASAGLWSKSGSKKRRKPSNAGTLPESIRHDRGLVDKYVEACKVYNTIDPKQDQLAEISKVSKAEWGRKLNNVIFLASLEVKLEKKTGHRGSKKQETRDFWLDAKRVIGDKLVAVNKTRWKQKAAVPYDDTRRHRDPFADLPEVLGEEQTRQTYDRTNTGAIRGQS